MKQKPDGETDYGIFSSLYYREICQCENCGVFFNRRADLFPEGFYEGKYNAAIEVGSIERRFQKIIHFPFSNSDNKNRVLRVVKYLYRNDYAPREMKVLDIGSGTCVFLYEMKKFGFTTHCIDPDPAAIANAKERAGVDKAIAALFDEYSSNDRYDLITFNKVLEHVENPVDTLKRANTFLKSNGLIYVELPDGERTTPGLEMIDRSEFFIDHHTIFNRQSFVYLAECSGFSVDNLSQIVDPSGKHTIYGFLRK